MSVNLRSTSWSVLNRYGKRKYITNDERERFLQSASSFSEEIQILCEIMAATGCRISEALSLTEGSFDFDSGVVVVECLKKRRRGVYREIPLPPVLLEYVQQWLAMAMVSSDTRIWPWSRMTAYRHIRAVMEHADLHGEHASPKGLRHGFAVAAIQSGVPLNLVQRWLGHADMSTTAIYASAIGPEERDIAARMWRRETDFERSRPDDECAGEDDTDMVLEPDAEATDARESCPGDAISNLEDKMQSEYAMAQFNALLRDIAVDQEDSTCPLIHFWLKCNRLPNSAGSRRTVQWTEPRKNCCAADGKPAKAIGSPASYYQNLPKQDQFQGPLQFHVASD